VALSLTASACGGGTRGGEAPAATTRTTSAQPEAGSCQEVPRALVAAIATRLTAKETLRNVRAVRSRDFKHVWFVSAEIDGPGLEGNGDIGTWAKTGSRAARGGLILSVDSVFAQVLSGWPAGDSTYAGVTMDDDGARESRDCVEAAQRRASDHTATA